MNSGSGKIGHLVTSHVVEVANTEQGKLKHLLETGASYAKEMQKKSKFATHSPVQVIDFIFFRLMIAYITRIRYQQFINNKRLISCNFQLIVNGITGMNGSNAANLVEEE